MDKEDISSMETLEVVHRKGRQWLLFSLTNSSWLVLQRRQQILKNDRAANGQNLEIPDVKFSCTVQTTILPPR